MSGPCRGPGFCGCCEGTDTVTPRPIFNRPGLPAIRWRVGEHADFLETMRSRIARVWVDFETGELGAHGRARKVRVFPLRSLRTRALDDPSIALLDLWSVVGDILSYYTERIAGEGYLRTATELLSVNELARLVGYRRRPGVAASVFLAFTTDDAWKKPVVVPIGAQVQSRPEPGETAVSFETDAPLTARAEWNVLRPRPARPTHLSLAQADTAAVLYLEGTATRLTPNTPLLLSYGEDASNQLLKVVASTQEDFDGKRTRVNLVGAAAPAPVKAPPAVDLDDLVVQLERPPSVPPASPARLALSSRQTFAPGSTAVDGLVVGFHPDAAASFSPARANARFTPLPDLESVSALRVNAKVYAHNAAPLMKVVDNNARVAVIKRASQDWLFEHAVTAPKDEDQLLFQARVLDLDTTYDSIVPDTWVVVGRPGATRLTTKVVAVETVDRTDYNLPATVTRLLLRDPWLPLKPQGDNKQLRLTDVRSTTVLAAPELVALTDELVEDPVCGAEIELDGQIDGLEPGRWLVVTGERAVTTSTASAAGPAPTTPESGDMFSVPGVAVTELTMVAAVRQDTLWVDKDVVIPPSVADAIRTSDKGGPRRLGGDRVHTFLRLATPLAYCYRRDTVRIYANVAHATHGETHPEPLGSGDGTRIFQTFTLKRDPLTYVAAPTPSGVESSLQVYVNDVGWHEAENVLDLGPADRGYLTFADHEEKTRVTFGDGHDGARLPTGLENVRSVYRSGLGQAGNVGPEQLSQLVTRTEGLRGVINPQRASGGADPEGTESTRARTPLAVAALDRLVATRDYADFALLFAGIGKASAARLPSRHGRVVQVTVAGEDDIPIDPTSDLHRNLLEALRRFGDPHLPVRLVRRELLALVIGAGIRLHPDYLWDSVRPQVEAALRARFGFGARDLAQDAYAAEVTAAMQGVPGVDYVDLDLFAAVSEATPASQLERLGTTLSGVKDRIPARGDRLTPATTALRPAQLVVLLASVPTTLMLTEIPHE